MMGEIIVIKKLLLAIAILAVVGILAYSYVHRIPVTQAPTHLFGKIPALIDLAKENIWKIGASIGGIASIGGFLINRLQSKTITQTKNQAENLLSQKTQLDAVNTKLQKQLEDAQALSTMTEQMKKDACASLLKDQTIEALQDEKKVLDGFIEERDRRNRMLTEEVRLLNAKVEKLQTELQIEKGEI